LYQVTGLQEIGGGASGPCARGAHAELARVGGEARGGAGGAGDGLGVGAVDDELDRAPGRAAREVAAVARPGNTTATLARPPREGALDLVVALDVAHDVVEARRLQASARRSRDAALWSWSSTTVGMCRTSVLMA
jgi:hypothetical protein